MPDISRSDSQRSDSSRPRVSFNRDVHVKRIASPRTVSAYTLLPDGSGLVPTAVRRERPRTRKEMQREARDVLKQANTVGCRISKRTGGRISSSEPDSGSSNENQKVNNFMSLDRKKVKKGKKNNLEYLSLEKNNEKNKLNLDLEAAKKKQLSPIIESPAADYFRPKKENNIDKMIRRLSAQSPTTTKLPGIVGVVKTPEGDNCHNQNLPFSYTYGVPEQGRENMRATSPTSDVIYAQVVVSGSEEPRKTTVHTRVSRTPDTPFMTHHKLSYGAPRTARSDLTTRVQLAPKYDPVNLNQTTDLHDLSIRRQILLSRTESQAKERLNTIKKLKDIRPSNGYTNARYIGNDITINNDKFENHVRKVPKDLEHIQSVNTNRTKRDTNEDTLMRKLSRFGKSKSFVETVPHAPKRGSSRLDLVKQIFRKKSFDDSEEDPVTTRYRESKGVISSDPDFSEPDIPTTRKRMPTPVSSWQSSAGSAATDTLTRVKSNKNNKRNSPSNWLKSLDRLTRKTKNRNDENRSEISSKTNSMRFFGDTDQESTIEDVSHLKQKYGLHRSNLKPYHKTDSESERPESRLTDSTMKGSSGSAAGGYKSKSKYDLDRPDYGIKHMNYRLNNVSMNNLSDTSTLKNGGSDYDLNGLKYGPNISRSLLSVSRNQSPPLIQVTEHENSPLSRRVQSYGNLYRPHRRRVYDSSADSATEYDSINSTKSTIYLHPATVGDIPGPRNMYKSEGKYHSRDELSNSDRTSSSPTKKTLSRSISILAPWRPKFRQDSTISYDTGGKPPTGQGKATRKSPPREPGKLGELRFNTIGRENHRQKDLLR